MFYIDVKNWNIGLKNWSDLVVIIIVIKSIVRYYYSIVRFNFYLICIGNDVFNCDVRNYLLI